MNAIKSPKIDIAAIHDVDGPGLWRDEKLAWSWPKARRAVGSAVAHAREPIYCTRIGPRDPGGNRDDCSASSVRGVCCNR
jgi:hypothetical protein